MNTLSVALVIALFGQSLLRADEPVTQTPNPMVLSRAIALEASLLASSSAAPSWAAPQPGQLSRPVDTRAGCVRHGTACFAALGYVVGFIAGLMTQGDFEPMALGLMITDPIGAGIGAAVGWGIAEGTKPVQTPPQP